MDEIEDNWYIVRGLKNGKVEVSNDERVMGDQEVVANMSVYAAPSKDEAVKYLHNHRPNAEYGATQYGKIKRLSNFKIVSDSTGGNKGHYLISGITIDKAKNIFS
ncbi:hypothetical protein [Helicobacter sp. MIT 05-5294]|uniref:hypothetical protein n=1 Tax=Helicobacter sp. MIT 05-5294 TaxID=1548150 RepID=UPI00051F897D|nr:hypothetical protein [Helicobacter sp. MIT 05-5294]TLD85485.1 hypothetical protein LS69_009300 [Helicobacter sp. MIT 05-5294]